MEKDGPRDRKGAVLYTDEDESYNFVSLMGRSLNPSHPFYFRAVVCDDYAVASVLCCALWNARKP